MQQPRATPWVTRIYICSLKGCKIWRELLNHLEAQNSKELLGAMKEISNLKAFLMTAQKNKLNKAAKYLKEQIIECIDIPADDL